MKRHHTEIEDDAAEHEISRRTFLGSMSAAVAGAAMPATMSGTEKPTPNVGASGMVRLVLNGRRHDLSVEPRSTLLHVLRDKLGMTGTKLGCERGECGACTVLIDGIARYSCLTLALEVDGKEVTTIEGLLRGDNVGPVQQAFVEQDAFQCGYCTPGQIMAAEALLRKIPNPSMEEIREEMSGNLCRCGAYQHIFRAVHRAAELRKA